MVLVQHAVASGQDGLLGSYYDDTQLTEFVESRLDPEVDFTNWVGAPTGTSVAPDDSYSERWTGSVFLDAPGDWTFSTVSNDGVRLFIGGVEVISNWTSHSSETDSVVLSLAPGWHPLTLEHYQDGGGVAIQLLFEGPGQAEEIIPSEHLSPTVMVNPFPTLDVGLDRVVVPPEDSILLESSAADPDGVIVQTQWTQVGGPTVTLTGADQPDVLVSGLSVPADHEFQVTVWDNDGLSATKTITVTVPACFATETKPLWQRVGLNIPGPSTDESATPNPFLDYRLDVLFTHGGTGQSWQVPGYYNADGRPEDSSATGGTSWRVDFTPGLTGGWIYSISFRQGPGIAVSSDPSEGTPLPSDGMTGCFAVTPVAEDATGFQASGRIVSTGGHYLVSSGSGEPFLQAGANSPENLLAYFAFDQTTLSHGYFNHIPDWNEGDAKWKGLGKGLVGAMNYLASEGMNTVWFLTFNVAGDANDVWPWTSIDERLRFDTSKLAQWNLVFEHMDTLGLQLHMVTQEQENDTGTPALDDGTLGVERKLYYRELIARFGHHLGVVWNLGEENTNSSTQLKQFHDYVRLLDPYDHPIVVHTFPSTQNLVFDPMLASGRLDGASLAIPTPADTYANTLYWRDRSAEMGRPVVVGADEVGPPSDGVLLDILDPEHDGPRKGALWGNLMAGGGGVQWYFGMAFPENDINCEDWRTRTNMWRQTRYAMDFFHTYLPFDQMVPDNSLVDAADAWCLAAPGQIYAVYLPTGGATLLDVGPGKKTYRVSWYDPRNGGPRQGFSTVKGPGQVSISAPTTAQPGDDWVALVELIVDPLIRKDGLLGGGSGGLEARTKAKK